jgi:hypothetical protein
MKDLLKEEIVESKLKKIENTFHLFLDGTRVLFLLRRKKDGGERADNDFFVKTIVNSKEEFLTELRKLMLIREPTMRIYASLNKRNVEKGIREFKRQQLEADYYDKDNKYNFYFRIKDRFVSSLSKPSCAEECLFLFDCDTLTDKTIGNAIEEIEKITDVVWHYRTKNGFHIITKPFNPAFAQDLTFDHEIKKDSLILLDY